MQILVTRWRQFLQNLISKFISLGEFILDQRLRENKNQHSKKDVANVCDTVNSLLTNEENYADILEEREKIQSYGGHCDSSKPL